MMSRTSHLKELQDELRPLFTRGIDEQDAYDQLKEDPRFGTLRLAKVSTIYKAFREQATKPKRRKSAKALHLERLQRSEQFSFFRSMVECDHKKNQCLSCGLYEKFLDGRFCVHSELISKTDNSGILSLFDAFSNKTSQIKLSLNPGESEFAYHFYPLTYNTGLLTENTDYADQYTFAKISVTLLEVDWTNKEIKKIHSVTIGDQQHRYKLSHIIVDGLDPGNFILRLANNDGSFILKFGCMVNDEISLKEKDIRGEGRYLLVFIDHWLFFGNKLCMLSVADFIFEGMISGYMMNLDRGRKTFSFEWYQFPEHVWFIDRPSAACVGFDRVFSAIQFKKTQHYGIVWSKFGAQQWVEMDFCVKERIIGIKFIADEGLLLVQTASKEDAKSTFYFDRFETTLYRIPLKKPEKLTDLAWFNLVRSKSRLPDVYSYEEAHKYLPYNSEIRAPFEE